MPIQKGAWISLFQLHISGQSSSQPSAGPFVLRTLGDGQLHFQLTSPTGGGGNFLAQYPIDIFSSWLRRFLAYIVPLAFVCYFPALYILDKPDPLGLPRLLEFSSPLVAAIAAVIAGLVWRGAVRHYRSAGG